MGGWVKKLELSTFSGFFSFISQRFGAARHGMPD
jgi:hypothetical protein